MDVFQYTISKKSKRRPKFGKDNMGKARKLLILLLIIIPTALSIYLLFKVNSLQKQIDMLMVDQYGMTYSQMNNSDKLVHAAGVDKTDGINEQESTEDNNEVETDDSDLEEAKDNNQKDDNDNQHIDKNQNNNDNDNIDKIDNKPTDSDGKVKDKADQTYEDETESDEETSNKKKVYLTFDDGPSKNTALILDILKQYDIKATFFVIGKTDNYSKEIYRRIVDEGHTLGLHSYSHRYDEIYSSLDKFEEDLNALSDLVYETTNYRSKFYRFPGGSGNSVSKLDMSTFINYIDDNGYTYFDWNVENGDATSKKVSAEEVYNNVMDGVKKVKNSTILMHDAQDKDSTVESLPGIIESLLEEDYLILPLSEESKPVQQIKVTDVVRD